MYFHKFSNLSSLVHYCSRLLAPQITVILIKLIEQGIFPAKLKTSYIVPIIKSSDVTNVQIYKAIFIQPALGRGFKSLVLEFVSFLFPV
jgi:hypothetical protein